MFDSGCTTRRHNGLLRDSVLEHCVCVMSRECVPPKNRGEELVGRRFGCVTW